MVKIFYFSLDEFMRREDKYCFLDAKKHIYNIEWQELTPKKNHTWLTEGLRPKFETCLPMGTKEAKAGRAAAIFTNYGRGVATSRDTWAYNFSAQALTANTIAPTTKNTSSDSLNKWFISA